MRVNDMSMSSPYVPTLAPSQSTQVRTPRDHAYLRPNETAATATTKITGGVVLTLSTDLQQAQKAWWNAKARGDQAGMSAAHQTAERLRAQGATESNDTAAQIRAKGEAQIQAATPKRDHAYLKPGETASVITGVSTYTASGQPAADHQSGGLLDKVVSGLHNVEDRAASLVKTIAPYTRPVTDFVAGATAETGINLGLGLARLNPDVRNTMDSQSRSFQYGRVAGDVISTVTGTVETIVGGAGTAGEAVAAPATFGATALAIPATAAVAVHGVGTAAAGVMGLPHSIQQAVSSPQQITPISVKGQNTDATLTVPRSKYPEAASHIEDAQANGHPQDLTIDRAGAQARRAESLAGKDKIPGKQLDEYPPAMFKEGGKGASVRPISPKDNQGAGAYIGNALRKYPDGAKVRIKVGD